jgi:methylglutaconyl-CoA hydratase
VDIMTDAVNALTMTVDGPVASLTFRRPEKSNAYNDAMLRALDDGVRRAGEDAAVRVLVLRGDGKHFSAGHDLSSPPGDPSGEPVPALGDVCLRLAQLPKPTIARVQGACIGGAMAFATCCDIVIAASDAFFSMPEVRIGFAPTPLAPFLLRAVGERHARRILMAGARLSAEEAMRIGLVSEVCPPEGLDQALTATIVSLLQSAPGAVATVKEHVARLADMAVTPDLLAELQRDFDTRIDSAEAREGRAARREKRPPNWAVKI